MRVNALHERVCALNSQVLDRERGSQHFRGHKITKQIAHTRKTSVFEPLACGVVCVVEGCRMVFDQGNKR